MKQNPFDKDDVRPVRLLRDTIKNLHILYNAQYETGISYQQFSSLVPFTVITPKPNDWGTSLCKTCLNPELKLERLAEVTNFHYTGIPENYDDQSYETLIASILSSKLRNGCDHDKLEFVEWIKTSDETGKKRASRKVLTTKSFKKFKKLILDELMSLKVHKYRIHMQYKAFKAARIAADENQSVATLQIDWSENCSMKQSREEKSAYYSDHQVSIHTMYCWYQNQPQSYAVLSDFTEHKASACLVSLQPIIADLKSRSVKSINIVSDSPTSQYRNKTMFYLMKKLCKENEIDCNWIYLEAGHGKGTPDRIGAVVKKAVRSMMDFTPSAPIYTVQDLMNKNLQ